MNIQEFEHQYQESISKILNDLQSMAIVSNRLESNIVEVGTSVQGLNQMVEDFLKQQCRTQSSSEPPFE
ncbi:MAG: hypothetical protein DCF15_00445 [Phormidesmis priestleyi]|uniref:Uncharacterized protein n=1 Tax=Phormidesmis priestleyi TaxID=268141 RepID=A0A2W4XZT2_9CYAN|nr:MAG: hypothetical protein DCF15_00445 [Phormidesmis priestleyi]